MKQLVDPISKQLWERKEKLAVAESVTGGDIQSALSVAENAMQFFELSNPNAEPRTRPKPGRMIDVTVIWLNCPNRASKSVFQE